MLFIKDLGLEHFISKEKQDKYENIFKSELPREEKIVQLLTLNPKFMTPSSINVEEEKYKKFKYKRALELIKKKIEQNSRLEFFALSFNVKPHIKEITNGLISPDASDFLTLLHLNLVFKYINLLHSPGAILKIGCQFLYFKKFNNISTKDAQDMNNIIFKYNRIAKELCNTTSKNFIQIFDVYESIQPYKKDFFLRIEGEKFNILRDDKNMKKINEGAEYYMNYVIDLSHFPNKEAAWNFCLYHTLDASAYRNVIFSMFDTNNGLFERLSENIKVETRFQNGSKFNDIPNSLYISFLPGASTFSFNRLTLKRSDGTWELATYKEITQRNTKSVFVKEMNTPFYFEEE